MGGACGGESMWKHSVDGLQQQGKVSLRDFMALPLNAEGQKISFGSIGHITRGEKCKPCLFYRKSNDACRAGSLCIYCHVDHGPAPPRRLLRKVRLSSPPRSTLG